MNNNNDSGRCAGVVTWHAARRAGRPAPGRPDAGKRQEARGPAGLQVGHEIPLDAGRPALNGLSDSDFKKKIFPHKQFNDM